MIGGGDEQKDRFLTNEALENGDESKALPGRKGEGEMQRKR